MIDNPPPIASIRGMLREGNLQQAFALLTERLARTQVAKAPRMQAADLTARYQAFVAQRQEMTQPERISERQQIEDELDALLRRLEQESGQSPRRPLELRFLIGLIAALILMAAIGLLLLSQTN